MKTELRKNFLFGYFIGKGKKSNQAYAIASKLSKMPRKKKLTRKNEYDKNGQLSLGF